MAGYGWAPVALIDGSWTNLRCGLCGGITCNCADSLKVIELPGPVLEIVAIVIDGVTLSPSAYRVDAQRFLIRQDDETWPQTQDMLKAPGAEGTWSIEFKRGVAVPNGGQIAAGVLACELAKAAADDADCRLPRRVSSVARQGVVVGLLDAFEGLEDGKTGIWLIDSWVASVNRPRPMVGVVNVDTMKRPGYTSRRGYGPSR